MGFVRRLNSKELVGDPCAGAEVYPITATNAVYREGGENLEDILTNLGNKVDKNVVDDVTPNSTNNTIDISYTNNTSKSIEIANEGSGNAVTSIDVISDTKIKANKSATFLTNIQCASAPTIAEPGTPSVTASTSGATTTLTFDHLKGADGASATITSASASVSEDGGSPSVTVTAGGTPSARTFDFAFKNINGKDGQDSTFNAADITVSNETELLNAIAYSHGWYFTKYNNNASHLVNDTNSDTSGGESKTTGPCITRIHFASNISLTSNYTVNLAHCDIYGYSFDLNFKNVYLYISGRSAKFNELRLTALKSDGSNRTSGDSDVFTFFKIKGVIDTHSKFRFINCQFNNLFPRDTFIQYQRASAAANSQTTYSTYIDGFETHSNAENTINITEDGYTNTSSSSNNDGNHNIIITRRYSTFHITVNLTAHTKEVSRLIRDSSVTEGTLTGFNGQITGVNMYS